MKRKGFTLIELLIVIAIIAILAIIIIMNLLNASAKAKYAKAKADLSTITSAIAVMNVDKTGSWIPSWSTSFASIVDDKTTQLIGATAPLIPSGWAGVYEFFDASATSYGARIPDPKTAGTYCGYLGGNLFTSPSSLGGGGSVNYSACTP